VDGTAAETTENAALPVGGTTVIDSSGAVPVSLIVKLRVSTVRPVSRLITLNVMVAGFTASRLKGGLGVRVGFALASGFACWAEALAATTATINQAAANTAARKPVLVTNSPRFPGAMLTRPRRSDGLYILDRY